MSQTISLTVPDALMEQARETAETTHRPVEAVLSEWLGYIAAERPVDLLSDEELLRVCDAQLPEADQKALSTLLDANREGKLDEAQRDHLDRLMEDYRRGIVRKAQALKVAVERGLRAPLS